MIPRDLEGKLQFVGKTLPEVIKSLRDQKYQVNVFQQGNELHVEIVQKIVIPLGMPGDSITDWPSVVTEKAHDATGQVGNEASNEIPEGSWPSK